MTTATTADVVRKAILEQLGKAHSTEYTDAKPASVAAPVAAVIPKTIVIEPGTALIKSILPKSHMEISVRVFNREDWPEHLQSMIPDIDPVYQPDTGAAEAILYAWANGDKTYISGPAGVGKSTLVQWLCAVTNRPMVRLNMSEDIEASSFLGSLTIKPGEGTVWIDGAVAEAAKHGAVLLLDEIDRGTAANLMPLQWLLEDNGKLFLRDKPGSSEERTIVPNESFRLVATGNTVGMGDETGMFASANVLDSATIDRFKTTVRMTYMDAAQEMNMLMNRTGVVFEAAQKMVQFAKLVRDAFTSNSLSVTCSPRVLISWAEKSKVFGINNALSLALLNKLRESDRKVVLQLFQKVYGS